MFQKAILGLAAMPVSRGHMGVGGGWGGGGSWLVGWDGGLWWPEAWCLPRDRLS